MPELGAWNLYDRIINLTLKRPIEDQFIAKHRTHWVPQIQYDTQIIAGEPRLVMRPFLETRIGPNGIREYKYPEPMIVETIYDTETVQIKCPDTGYKPTISVTYDSVVGHVCYSIDVRVTNLHLTYDIRSFTGMEIQVGYRDFMSTLSCSIVTSYVESPGPDGITVFKCLTVGELGALFDKRNLVLRFNKKDVTVEDLVIQMSRILSVTGLTSGDNITTIWNISQATKQLVVLHKCQKQFSTGYSALNWAQSKLNDLSQKSKHSITLNVIDNQLVVMEAGYNGAQPLNLSLERVILKRIISASFVGPLLTVIAPYSPNLKPGSIFYMSPNYYNGSLLLNMQPESMFRGSDAEYKDAYSIITMKVEFSTTENINRMTIVALPVQSIGLDISGINQTQAALLQQYYNTLDETKNKTEVVEDEPDPVQPEAEEIKKDSADWYDVNAASLLGKGKPGLIKPGDTLERIAAEYYKDLPEYTKKPDEFDFKNDLPYPGVTRPSYSAQYYMWPLIALCTYKSANNLDGFVSEGLKFDEGAITNPELIHNGYYLYIPQCTSIEQFEMLAKPVKELYLRMGNFYDSLENKKTYKTIYYNIYAMLGGKV